MLALCASGAYPSCPAVTAAGRPTRLLGLTRADVDFMEETARALGTSFVLLGSRVSGPRSRQRGLHPALAALPLKSARREASALSPGHELEIDKTSIKDYGRDDPRTSDLTAALVDPRTGAPRRIAAEELERALDSRGWDFRARVFAVWDGAELRTAEDFLR